MKIASKIIDFLLPRLCLFCNKPCEQSQICSACYRDLPWLKTACPQCANLLEQQNQICGQCLNDTPAYHSTLALFQYLPPIDHLILGLKFRQKLAYARVLAELLTKKILEQQAPLPEIIIPLPLHHLRLKERGFNQALEIAKPIAKALNIPLDIQSARRIKVTLPQASIPAAQRKKNVWNAFSVDLQFSAKHIGLIDDVITTGHTVNALAQCYRKLGVERIDVWCCRSEERRVG